MYNVQAKKKKTKKNNTNTYETSTNIADKNTEINRNKIAATKHDGHKKKKKNILIVYSHTDMNIAQTLVKIPYE